MVSLSVNLEGAVGDPVREPADCGAKVSVRRVRAVLRAGGSVWQREGGVKKKLNLFFVFLYFLDPTLVSGSTLVCCWWGAGVRAQGGWLNGLHTRPHLIPIVPAESNIARVAVSVRHDKVG